MPEEDDPTSALGRGWKSTFLCDNKADAEKGLLAIGSKWEWQNDGCLRTTTKTLPAIKTDERSGRKTFFNAVVAAYTGWNDSRNAGERAVRLGDAAGSPIEPAFVRDAVAIMKDIQVAFQWQQGDILLLDNRTTMHSRNTFE